ncbi:MAG: DUF4426 domain-containing protein [Lysobacter sp.]
MSRSLRSSLTLLLGAALLLGCSSEPSSPATGNPAPSSHQQETTTRIGDTTVRATVLQTAMLGELVAGKYGIVRAENQVMLLIGLRQGESSKEASVPARITATATDLRGQRHTIELRELHSGDLLDYFGTVKVSLPDTLRFELDITLESGAHSTMRFNREFLPL